MNVLFALFGSFMIGIVVTLPYIFKKKVHYIDFSKEKIKKTKVDKKIKVAKESEIEATSKLSSLSIDIKNTSLSVPTSTFLQ